MPANHHDPKPIRPTHAKTRLTLADRGRLDAAHVRFKTNDTDVLEGLILAYLEAVEAEGRVSFPITIMMAPIGLRAVAEPPAAYQAADDLTRHAGDILRDAAKKGAKPKASRARHK